MPRHPAPKAVALVFLASTVAGVYFATQLHFAYPAAVRGTWSYALFTNLTHYWIWGALVPVVVRLARRFPLDATHWRRSVPAHLVLGAALTAMQIVVATAILKGPSLATLARGLVVNAHSSYPTYWLILLAYTVWRAASLGARLADARLEALRAQLQPHFLFNTLNSVSSLMYSDVEAADAMLARLADLLRLTLAGGPRREIPLTEELELCMRYLDIERFRFEERLGVDLDIDPAARAARVPPLLLQPLVENAVRHAIAPRDAGGRLTISARLDGRALIVRVIDDGPGPPEHIVEGVGLSNTRARLAELYGPSAHLKLTGGSVGGATAEVIIPQ